MGHGAGRCFSLPASVGASTRPRCHLRAPSRPEPAGSPQLPAPRPGLETNRGCLGPAGGFSPASPRRGLGGGGAGEAAPAPGEPSTHAVGPPRAGERRGGGSRPPPGCPVLPPPRPAAPEHPRPRSGAIRGECVPEFLLLEMKFRVGSVLGKGVFL